MGDLGLAGLSRDDELRSIYRRHGADRLLHGRRGRVPGLEPAERRDAVEGAGQIHTDLAKGFVRAEVVTYDDFRKVGSMKEAKSKGVYRLEGQDLHRPGRRHHAHPGIGLINESPIGVLPPEGSSIREGETDASRQANSRPGSPSQPGDRAAICPRFDNRPESRDRRGAVERLRRWLTTRRFGQRAMAARTWSAMNGRCSRRSRSSG